LGNETYVPPLPHRYTTAWAQEYGTVRALRFATRRLLNEDAHWFVPESARPAYSGHGAVNWILI
jgi:hypothetical protein